MLPTEIKAPLQFLNMPYNVVTTTNTTSQNQQEVSNQEEGNSYEIRVLLNPFKTNIFKSCVFYSFL